MINDVTNCFITKNEESKEQEVTPVELQPLSTHIQ